MWSDAISEVNPQGKTVWEWKAYEHLDPELDIICPVCWREQWGEATSLGITAEGDILVNFIRIGKILLVNKATGKVEWRFGEWPEITHPHNAILLENGNLVVFESGVHMMGYEAGRAQILEFDRQSGDEIWQYDQPNAVDFIAPTAGNCQRLPNGNILVCEGDYGRIFEVNRSKELVWEYNNPFYNNSKFGRTNMVAYAQRYSFDYGGLKQ